MKVAIIGCGSIGRRHARNLIELGVNDSLLVDSEPKRAAALARELAAGAFLTTAEVYAQRPDVALICTPTRMHLALAWEALENECHVFVEKPLSHSMQGVCEFVEAADLRKRVLMVGYNFRFDPILNQVKTWLAERKIGRVTSARFHFGSYLPWRHPWEDYRKGYGAQRELGGGAILDAVHELDMALWLFGQPDAIYCAGGKYSDLEIDVEDSAEILMSYRKSLVSIHLDYIDRPAERYFSVIGMEGRIEADLFSRTARYFDGEKRSWCECGNCGTLDETYCFEMRHLLNCINGNETPLVDGKIAIESLLLAERAKASMCRKLPVPVDGLALEANAR